MQPSLDTWTSIFLIAVATGFFLFTLLITGNKKNKPIAFLVLAFSIILFQYVLYWTNYESVLPYLVMLPPVCYYATGPLLYRYFVSLYGKSEKFNYPLHFSIAALALVPNLVLWLKYLGAIDPKMKFPLLFLIDGHWIIAGHMILYSTLIIVLIAKHPIRESEFQKLRHNWAKVLIFLYVLFVFAYISYYILVNFSFFNDQWDYMISIMMSFSIYSIGYFLVKQPSIFDGEMYSNLFLPLKNKGETFETSLLNEFYEKIKKHMENEKPYRDNELRLVHLADQLGYSTHLLSKVINKRAGKNFNHFVNEYRLAEAEKLISENTSARIKSIYFDVGFNNKATFYKAFKNKYQCTPSEYKSRKETL